MTNEASLTTLLVGVDGACREVLDPLFDAGAVPTLERLFETGASGPLESQIPPWTASAWPSLYTGTNPGKHGVFGFLAFDGYDWDVVDAADVAQPPLWQLLDQWGVSSVVVNVPVTAPPGPVDGALVPGYTAPDEPPCHPDGVLDDLQDALGEYRVYPEHTGESGVTDEEIVAEHVALAGMRGRAFSHLAEEFDPEFGFVQFQGTDSVVHEVPGDRDALREVYRTVDEQVEAIIEEYDPETVIVASDHGVGPIDGYDVRINDALDEAGLVETERGGDGMPTWATVRDGSLSEGTEGANDSSGLAERAVAGLARFGLTSQRIASVLEPVGLDEVVARIVPTATISAATEQVDFPASRAYARSRIECGVRLNVAGREPDGVVPESEYEATREQVIEALSRLETPDGDPAFERVARRERFFEGPAVEDAPDVVTVPRAFDHLLSTQIRGEIFGPPSESWNHKRNGIVTIAGGSADVGATVSGAHLYDVAPTVLATFGLPAADRMDGSVLAPVDPQGRREYPDVETVEGRSQRTDAIERRLADLGYIE